MQYQRWEFDFFYLLKYILPEQSTAIHLNSLIIDFDYFLIAWLVLLLIIQIIALRVPAFVSFNFISVCFSEDNVLFAEIHHFMGMKEFKGIFKTKRRQKKLLRLKYFRFFVSNFTKNKCISNLHSYFFSLFICSVITKRENMIFDGNKTEVASQSPKLCMRRLNAYK